MANKYIFHGATFNGDGTSSAAAASDGGVGAWNNINIFQGTAPAYGVLSGNDVINVRTKDAAGNDITVTLSAATTLGSSAGTELSPITWIFDNGSVWPGVAGVITYAMTNTSLFTTRDFNNIEAFDNRLVFTNTGGSGTTDGAGVVLGNSYTSGIKVDHSGCTNAYGPQVRYRNGTHERLFVRAAGYFPGAIRASANGVTVTLIDPQIELTSSAETEPVISVLQAYGVEPVRVFGGRVFGVGATNGRALTAVGAGGSSGSLECFGLAYPREMPLSTTAVMTGPNSSCHATGADGDFGTEYFSYFYAFTSRSDNNPPTLNAYLETSGQKPWSYRLWPHRTTQQSPALINLSKTWTQAAAVKTITQELLWPTTMAAPTKDCVFMRVQYIDDTTGLPVSITTRAMAGGTLDTSTAAWSATTWGVVSLSKYKLAITTPTKIKQDSAVLVTLVVMPRAATTNDVLFVDPDPVFS